jgi:hypothetical protein
VRSTAAAPVLGAVIALLLVGGCSPDAAIDDGASPSAAVATARPRDSVPPPDPTAIAQEAEFGTWRPAPAPTTPDFRTAVEDACRTDDTVGDLPLRVLDARGLGLATLVFADDERAVLCRAAVDAPGGQATATVRPIAAADGATAPEARTLGIHDLEVVDETSTPRIVAVGTVGDGVNHVAVNHDDATWTKGQMANGWYAVWWPLAKDALGIAAVDNRNIVIDSFAP